MNKKIKQNYDNTIHKTFSYGVIYIYSIPDKKHKGRLKIGSATISSLNLTKEDIYSAADRRIKQQTKTADIHYNLEHAELAVTNGGNYFSDYNVHEILKRSGYKRKSENVRNSHSEWFEVSLEVAKKAIQAVKEGRIALTTKERISNKISEFPFRPNQRDAIDKTIKAIKKHRKHFLWNAKMRFGKTSAAMQVAKENKMKKVLIVTHRPSVSVDWFDDFNKVLASANYEYASKTKGEKLSILLKNNKPFIYFASLQDLRLSKRVTNDESAHTQAEGFKKNEEIFDTTWDMVIIDEAHEGTQSNLGDTTFSKIPTNFTLQLSGTPFNILYKHEEKDIYTWDYVMEQEAKLNWDEQYSGVPNPYAELPSLSIFTYDVDTFANHIGSLGKNFHDSLDGAFKFHEFFRVHKDNDGNDISKFIHKSMVKKFLNLLVNNTLKTKFPYATEEYRSYNKHSLWLLPNRVKVIEAMENLLKEHEIFGSNAFGIVNISGNNYNDDEDKDAKNRVAKAIKDHEYTITLTGQRLTTGASIKEWTAIFMMSDTNSATTYLQTAFRCQTPAKIDGKLKTQGYVFDFAPDRTLKLIAEAIELNHKSGKTNSPEQKEAMRQFLNFCPILAAEGGKMKPYDVGNMLNQLKKAIIERVQRNGFDDPKLYNDELLQLDELDINKFNELKRIIGKSNTERINEIDVNNLGMDDLQRKKAEEAERKKRQKKELSEEEKEALKKLKEARDQKNNAINILRAVSIRMPMLVYGANVSIKEDITLQKFIDLVDDESWEEFMPVGLTKEGFGEFTKYYDEDVFKGVAHSIRAKAFDCDDLLPTERIQAITEIFSTFKNPDKETVLTPWNVVNMHLTTAFGGHDFTSGITDKLGKPEWKSLNVNTSVWEQDDTKILEINSKSGLYPLLAAYNVYSRKLKNNKKLKKSEEKIFKKIWDDVLANNIYVLCKSPMAKSITQRTLAGYSEAKTKIVYIEDLVKKLQHKDKFKEYDLRVELLEKFNLNKDMKFTAVVGNPPYQETVGKTETQSQGNSNYIYHHFQNAADNIADKTCLIYPFGGWFDSPNRFDGFGKRLLSDGHTISIYAYEGTIDRRAWYRTDKDPKPLFGGSANLSAGIAIVSRNLKQKQEDFLYFNRVYSDKKVSVSTNDWEVLTPNPEFMEWKKLLKGKKLKSRIVKGVFGIESNFVEKNPKKVSFKKTDWGNPIQLLTNNKSGSAGRATMFWVERDVIKKGVKYLDLYKVITTSAYPKQKFSSGKPTIENVQKRAKELIEILPKGSAFGASRLSLFMSKDEKECQNFIKYTQTRFFAFLLLQEPNQRSTIGSVILDQNFTDKSDIDWSKSIAELDKQLYAKYKLDKKEIDFIETHVKEMK